MALTTTEANEISADYCDEVFVQPNATATLTTADVKDAAESLNTFIEASMVALNNALPVPFKTLATTQQKLRLFKHVVVKLADRS